VRRDAAPVHVDQAIGVDADDKERRKVCRKGDGENFGRVQLIHPAKMRTPA